MPRIDPLQLLNCLQILLNKDGGILSREEVQRLVNLMTKFSKKLVSKVIYTLILKSTEPSLIALFMAEGGWRLIHLWLQEAMNTNNMSLTKEVLELLLIAPVDVCLLRSNYGIPKLVKTLTKKDDPEIQKLSKTLVEDWLRLIKGNTNTEQQPAQIQEMPQIVQEVANVVPQRGKLTETTETSAASVENSEVANETESEENDGSVYKLSVRDGKHVISRFPQTTDEVNGEETVGEVKAVHEEKESTKENEEKKKEKSSNDRSKHKSSRSSSSSSKSSSSKDKHRDKERSSSSSSSSKDKKSSSSSSSSRDKDKKDRKDRDKDRHRSNGSLKSSSSSSSSKSKDRDKEKDKDKNKKESKEKQAEKDKDTLSKVLPQTPQKLARIPKKPSDEKSKETADKPKEVKKDKNFSIEPRKPGEERPRTVKVFNAKMRSTGLEEEVKPPPPRTGKKPTPSVTLPSIPQKRPSPIKDIVIPEKKQKIEIPERPGAIKLIPPKPKPAVLQESDIFMDALTASATAKKEPKKRKRRASVSKDSNTGSPPQSPAVNQNTNSPNPLKNITAPKFYQDTLEEKADDVRDDTDDNQGGSTPTDNSEPMDESNNVSASTVNKTNRSGLKSVLVHGKRSGPKKSIRWKPDENLVDVQYFELDETERVNVTKNFMDMAKMEMTSEREALQASRKLQNEDLMDVQTVWRKLIEMELSAPMAIPGSQSLEKDIQFAREKSILQALYFNKRMTPDSAAEPDPENHQMTDPVLIPLEDPVNNQEQDLRNVPWPEPKGSPPPEPQPINMPPLFQTPPNQFPNFPNIGPPANFQGIPPQFPAGPGNPPNFIPPNMVPNDGWGNPQMMPPDMINQPNMFGPGGPNGPPPDNFNPMMENFNPMQFNQPNMFPPNNFNMPRGGRGGFRGRGGPWVRMNGPTPGGWHRGGGAPHRGGRLCKNVKIHGYCRNRDNCPFVHPN